MTATTRARKYQAKNNQRQHLGPASYLAPLALALSAIAILCGCKSLNQHKTPRVIEQSYSPTPIWLEQSQPAVFKDGSLQLVYKSPAVPNLDIAANQLADKITMRTKEQLSQTIEDALMAAQPEPLSLSDTEQSAIRQAISRTVAQRLDKGDHALHIEDYYYQRTRTGNEAPLAEVYALVKIADFSDLVRAVATRLQQSPSRTLRALASPPANSVRF